MHKLYYYIPDRFNILNKALISVDFAIAFLASYSTLADNSKNIAITHLF